MSLPNTERVGTETIRDIEFAVDKASSGELIGHCWAQDEVSGIVCGLVASGEDLPSLRTAFNEQLDAITEHLRDDENKGVEPKLVGKGWDYNNPPPARRKP